MSIQLPRRPTSEVLQKAYRGCLLGGAVGDALGAPVEFMSLSQIEHQFGVSGIQEYVPAFGKLGAVTDDTQMTLFTAEGVLRAFVCTALRDQCYPVELIAMAYQRWLHTQGVAHPLHVRCLDGWLLEHQDLFSRRAPGLTCLSGLQSMKDSSSKAHNDSKGCGGVMRVAPIGMFYATLLRRAPLQQHNALLTDCFRLACDAAAVTHGHGTGQLASGAFATIIMKLLLGVSLPESIGAAQQLLASHPGYESTSFALATAQSLTAKGGCNAITLQTLGGGWIAEEALAIAVCCALHAEDFRTGVAMSVNHGGDSDSTGSIAGQILGAMYGAADIPFSWLDTLELRSVVEDVADDLASFSEWTLGSGQSREIEFYANRYPGH